MDVDIVSSTLSNANSSPCSPLLEQKYLLIRIVLTDFLWVRVLSYHDYGSWQKSAATVGHGVGMGTVSLKSVILWNPSVSSSNSIKLEDIPKVAVCFPRYCSISQILKIGVLFKH